MFLVGFLFLFFYIRVVHTPKKDLRFSEVISGLAQLYFQCKYLTSFLGTILNLET